MKANWLCTLVVFISTAFLSGCWSNQELPDLALVSAIGVDKTEDGRYMNTIQVINPGNVAGESRQGTGGTESPPVSTYMEKGNNMVQIQRQISKKVPRRLYYAHTNLLVLGEKLVREEGVKNIFDALERDNEFRTNATVVIAQESTASELVKILTPIDQVPAEKIVNTLKYTERMWGENLNVAIRDVLPDLVSSGKEPVISCFSMYGDAKTGETLESIQETKPKTSLKATGLGIFKDGKLVDIVQGDMSKGVIWALDEIKATLVSVDWKEKQEAVVYEVIRQKTDVGAEINKNEKGKITIDISVEGDIGETAVPISLKNPRILYDVEDKVEKKIKANIESSVKKAQDLQTDIFGFGDAMHQSNPKMWKEWKKEWDDVYFPELEIDVTVNAFIRRTGLRNEPFFLNLD
ncbi:Ger(x)C family spore germination protein [Salibacterium salarium]|uniref:Ger(X)C family spore germination protein n=1 Tax=Salibacterium salarium TaxID=284579 RepID=A0A428N8L0_9BACI|nr:Ger(x)C family spore germination protein [Salibacterium salarium]RSL34726.1 Ger(x)C family spore germination protein [Salibacterium salarium]